MKVLSLGGGTQSCGLALMSAVGELPKLDHVVFADTGGERPETYEYISYLKEILEKNDIPLSVTSNGDLREKIYQDVASNKPLIPITVIPPDGSTKGKVGKYTCSYDFKRRPIARFVKKLCGKPGDWKKSTVEQWIGYSVDEIGRVKPFNECRCGKPKSSHPHEKCNKFDPWMINKFPLIDMGFSRQNTIDWFERNGFKTPMYSSCSFCPHSSNERWSSTKRDHPDLWEQAVHLDEFVRNEAYPRLLGEGFLHSSGVPLKEADIRTKADRERDAGVMTLFGDTTGECDSGVCFT